MNTKTNYLLTLKAEDRPGLLHLVTGIPNKKQIPIISLNAAPTDIHDIVLITMEIEASEKALTPLLFKLENIVEVFEVEAIESVKASCLRAAYFRLDKAALDGPLKPALQKHGAVIANLYPDAILVSKFGSDMAIRTLYNELEGPHLLGFSQTGLIVDSALIGHSDKEQSSVIRQAA
jgi:acetolactate synthase small subunit